ncbi:hypothetical protein D3C71_1659380 [compost metagenome]
MSLGMLYSRVGGAYCVLEPFQSSAIQQPDVIAAIRVGFNDIPACRRNGWDNIVTVPGVMMHILILDIACYS